MIPILLLLVGALQQQPARQPSSPAPVTRASAVPVTAIDSTVHAISEIGVKIAEMRSVYDLYRRAAYNEPDGALIQRANMFASSCREMATAVQRGHGYICRSCMARKIQADVNQYRAYLPALQRLGASCASRLERIMAGTDVTARHRALRTEATPQGARMVSALRTYEANLQRVRIDLNWTTGPAPRRGE